jgi:catechol 2,3-dioxygenase-like lactoylglutathione lyase family enzyme
VRIQAIIETAIYVDDLRAAEAFYGTILGLPVIGKEPGRHVFFQVGEASVLLAFLAEASLGPGVHQLRPRRPGAADRTPKSWPAAGSRASMPGAAGAWTRSWGRSNRL